MGAIKGFMEFDRETPPERPIDERLKDWREVYDGFPEQKFRDQGARCMDCGVPFCQSDTGCPLGNMIPDWNDLVYRDEWEEAVAMLLKTNNFPEFTGRICPAPCEESCVLGINEPPVTICKIEKKIADKGFEMGFIKPNPPEKRTGKSVAVVGSGPAGLACADQLNQAAPRPGPAAGERARLPRPHEQHGQPLKDRPMTHDGTPPELIDRWSGEGV